ncbi:hypothetical protein A3F66_06590 [candidate division TM6 bacterium RIFCSPHIGHO2_12_FULL_32_22]|nr:MAG: hypothetical protein A3F66_06590 [candidate division TM6 bacterium RIFCSPHIGHO2_12_FULL_32_22]
MLNELNVISKKEKSNLNNTQKTFNRLIKQVKDLQQQQVQIQNDLNIALKFYYEIVKPDEIIWKQSLIDRLDIAYKFYKNPIGLTKKELKIFKEWLSKEIHETCLQYETNEVPDKLKEMYKELTGSDYQEVMENEFQDEKSEIQGVFKEMGIDIDLTGINIDDAPEDIMFKMFSKIDLDTLKNKKKPTKKQLERDLKKQQFEEMQAKSLNSIYKQLVRELHPDLEQDVNEKLRKEELMKRLTGAYKNNDLFSILTIQMEWMDNSAKTMHLQKDENLKIYNSILKDQIEELKMSVHMLFMNPRYFPLQKIYVGEFTDLEPLKNRHAQIKEFTKNIKENITRLSSPQGKDDFKKLVNLTIKEKTRLKKAENYFSSTFNCDCGNC